MDKAQAPAVLRIADRLYAVLDWAAACPVSSKDTKFPPAAWWAVQEELIDVRLGDTPASDYWYLTDEGKTLYQEGRAERGLR